MTDGLD